LLGLLTERSAVAKYMWQSGAGSD